MRGCKITAFLLYYNMGMLARLISSGELRVFQMPIIAERKYQMA
jgi:hypothetical protein